MTKSFLASKTFWVNFLTIVVAVAAFYGVNPDQDLFEKVSAGMIFMSPVINLVLRFFTTKPVSVIPDESQIQGS
jgi:hypothetical protein